MRFAIFSDVHGNLEALEAILFDVKKSHVDEVICLGDVLAIGPDSKACLDLIFHEQVRLLIGNHELYYTRGTSISPHMSLGENSHQNWVVTQLTDADKVLLQNQPLLYEIETGGKQLVFSHFFLNEMKSNEYPFKSLNLLKTSEVFEVIKKIEADFIFYGHEHGGSDLFVDHQVCINVESAGCTKDQWTSYLIFETDEEKGARLIRKRIPYNREKFENKMQQLDYPEKKFIEPVFFGIERT